MCHQSLQDAALTLTGRGGGASGKFGVALPHLSHMATHPTNFSPNSCSPILLHNAIILFHLPNQSVIIRNERL